MFIQPLISFFSPKEIIRNEERILFFQEIWKVL